MVSVLEWLEETADKYPEKEAFIDTKDKITFGEVRNIAKTVGSALLEQKLSSKPVAVFCKRGAITPAIFLGVVYSGAAYAPIDANLPTARIEKILATLKPERIIVDEEYMASLQKIVSNISVSSDGNVPEICLVNELLKVPINEPELVKVRRKATMFDPLYIIFTSGSTGEPKGVITSHESLVCYIKAYAEVMRIEEEDRLGNQSPLDYIAAIRDIYLPIKIGCSTLILPKQYFMEPDKLFECMNEYGVTAVGWSVSAFTILSSLGAFEDTKLSSLRKVCFSGSVMPGSCLKMWQSNLPDTKFVNQYGPTEATASCTYYEVDHIVDDGEILPIGIPYKNYKVFLINKDGKLAETNEKGEICVSGPCVTLGYYNNPEKTAKSFVQNPLNDSYQERIYRTGDIGLLREDGLLEYHGRMDRQIKHMGHRVELDEIECCANQIKDVDESCCMYQQRKEVIYLFYSGSIEKKDLILALRNELPGFMIPRKVIGLQELPKLPNGKLDMNSLRELMK